VRINPSILAADFVNMEADLARIAGADFVHVDIMDNHFVPNLTFGPQMVGRIQATSPVPLDVHLMIDEPERWAPEYAELGAASVTFHLEAATEPIALARRLRAIGARAGLAVKPATQIEGLFDVLGEFDQILIMTVEPGFGGQSFMADVADAKLGAARRWLDPAGAAEVQVDGGGRVETAEAIGRGGTDVIVAGSALYRAPDMAAEVERIRSLADAARLPTLAR
jgi:ribulose-phosphate 3-epimerase